MELAQRRQKANQVRTARREKQIRRIIELIQRKGKVNNNDIRNLLHVSRNTAINYLDILEKTGTVKSEGKGRATTYHF